VSQACNAQRQRLVSDRDLSEQRRRKQHDASTKQNQRTTDSMPAKIYGRALSNLKAGR